MTQSAALLRPPSHPGPDAANNALPTSARPRTQSLEDRRLAERVECALRSTGYGRLRNIGVNAQARGVILAGRVPSYYLKQVAQAVALAVPGVHQVRNDLEVGRPI
jgi:osmotically-inducible protein OsmY